MSSGETASHPEGSHASTGVSVMNEQTNTAPIEVIETVEHQPTEKKGIAGEALGVPIGRVSSGQNGALINFSSTLDYSGSVQEDTDSDIKDASKFVLFFCRGLRIFGCIGRKQRGGRSN